MKFRPIIIGLVACFVLPLAGANARIVFEPGLNSVGAGADLPRGVGQMAEKFWRDDHCDKDDKGNDCHRCNDGDRDDKDKDDKNHKDCDRSPSKPH